MNTSLEYKSPAITEILPQWNYFVDEIASVFNFTNEEKCLFYKNNTAKIIAIIPFEANCIEPERTAIAHLCLYVAEIKGFQKYCSHLPSDDINIFNRLSLISTFEGGNQSIIHHGMSVLALIMLEGYKKSISKDRQYGKYNPLVSGTWNYRKIKNQLLSEINKIEVPNIDWIFIHTPLNMW